MFKNKGKVIMKDIDYILVEFIYKIVVLKEKFMIKFMIKVDVYVNRVKFLF